MKLLIIRPEPGASASAARAQAAGFDAVVLPFFAVEPRNWDVPKASNFDALLLTSANAVRHGGSSLTALSELPVHAVGHHTADAAKAAGFTIASSGETGIEGALDNALRLDHARILWLAGEDRREPSHVLQPEIRTVYASEPMALPDDASATLRNVEMIALHSPRAAKQLMTVIDALGFDRGQWLLVAFSPAIAAAAGSGWRGLAVAKEPNDRALLSAAIELGKQHGFAIARKAQS